MFCVRRLERIFGPTRSITRQVSFSEKRKQFVRDVIEPFMCGSTTSLNLWCRHLQFKLEARGF